MSLHPALKMSAFQELCTQRSPAFLGHLSYLRNERTACLPAGPSSLRITAGAGNHPRRSRLGLLWPRGGSKAWPTGPEPRPGRAAPEPAPDTGTQSGRAGKDPGATRRTPPCSSRGCSSTSIRGALQWGESGRIAPAMHPKALPKASSVHFCW